MVSIDAQSISSRYQVDVSLLEGPFDQFVKRQEFQRELYQNVGSIKSCVTSLGEDIKALKMQKSSDKAKVVKERFHSKQTEIRALIRDVKGSLDQIGEHLKEEKRMLISDINNHKAKLSDILGYGDEVKGFDNFVLDD